jgi:parvulin-like peptidyl-prolyl isomerase
MAKRKQQRKEKVETTLTYKQLARQRVEKKHRRRMLIASAGIAALVTIILVVAVVNELVIKPGQPVASVNDTNIGTERFQERVRLERDQIIQQILQYAQIFGVEQVTSYADQLNDYEAVGEQVLDTMADEVLIKEGATELVVGVSDDEVLQYLEEQVGYYRNGTPTPAPTLTPLPSATPITETVTTPTPTRTPFPTPTVVTEEAFNQFFQQQLDLLKQIGVSESVYLDVLKTQLLVDKIRTRLMEGEPVEAEQVEAEVLIFTNEDDVNTYLARLQSGESFDDLMTAARENTEDDITATNIPWTPREELASQYSQETADVVFSLAVGERSDVIATEDGRFLIFYVTGHEERPLGASILRTREDTIFNDWLTGLRDAATIDKYDYWRSRVPHEPVLDPRFLTPTPMAETGG